MKAFVQNKKTQLYLGQKGKWVRERSQAMEFERSSEALDYGMKHRIRQIQIVLDFGKKEDDLKVEVG